MRASISDERPSRAKWRRSESQRRRRSQWYDVVGGSERFHCRTRSESRSDSDKRTRQKDVAHHRPLWATVMPITWPVARLARQWASYGWICRRHWWWWFDQRKVDWMMQWRSFSHCNEPHGSKPETGMDADERRGNEIAGNIFRNHTRQGSLMHETISIVLLITILMPGKKC